MEIEEIIEKGENQKVEFKLKVDESLGKSICAFANTNNGIILVGVSDKGKIKGAKEKHEEKIANLAHTCKPSIYPEIEKFRFNDKIIFLVKVKKSDQIYSFKNVAYKRVGTHDKPLSPEEVVEVAKSSGKIRWDEQVCEGATIEDIDEEKVRWFLKKAKYERDLDVDPKAPLKEVLTRLKLIKNGNLKNAAVLLFGENPQKFFLQAETKCARFKGTKPLEFIDMKSFDGNIIDQREDALEFIKEHIKLHAKIVETEREERWEYPIEAVREAITNAICHRDYQTTSKVQVRIFDDRIEVWGVGPLPEPLTPEDLKKEHRSILRNPLIGKCFFLIKYIEEWGTGTNRMVDRCVEHGLPEPEFEEISGGLVVTFRKKITEEFLRKKGLNERQIKAVKYVRGKNNIRNKEYQELFDVSKRTATSDLAELVEKNVFKKTGKGRKIRYVLR